MAESKVSPSPGLEDRLLEYAAAAAAAEAVSEHGASDPIAPGLLPALPLLDSPETFVADMKEAAVLVGAVRSILEKARGVGPAPHRREVKKARRAKPK
jgi:hypothetical protein